MRSRQEISTGCSFVNIVVHKAEGRGSGEYGWLKTRYSFSFADWYEPNRLGFGALRVINDDVIAPKSGFGEHGHRDMEIITIVTEGAVTHTDSMGNEKVVKAGEVQVMSAGTGVVHAERNESLNIPLKLFQIWIESKEPGIAPRYAQKAFDFSSPGLITLVSHEGNEGLAVNQDACILQTNLRANEELVYKIKKRGNGLYIFIVSGEVVVGGQSLKDRDAAGVTEANEIKIAATFSSRLYLFDIPLK